MTLFLFKIQKTNDAFNPIFPPNVRERKRERGEDATEKERKRGRGVKGGEKRMSTVVSESTFFIWVKNISLFNGSPHVAFPLDFLFFFAPFARTVTCVGLRVRKIKATTFSSSYISFSRVVILSFPYMSFFSCGDFCFLWLWVCDSQLLFLSLFSFVL